MATNCPVCNKGTLRVGEKFVYCSEKITEKIGNDFIDKGCLFRIAFEQKIFGQNITPAEIKALVEGKTITSKKGHKMTLDLGNKYFTKTDKKADEDL